MKYVRTKDGRIHCFLGKNKDEFGFYYLDTNKEDKYRCDNNYYRDCKEADTIEELCDEFILVAPYRFRRPKTATELEKDFEEMKYFYTNKNDTIYGAIWIELDNGAMRLEPVAKMNEKRELELL